MKTEEDPDADRSTNSNKKTVSPKRFIPRIKIVRVNQVDNTVINSKINNKIQILVIFERPHRESIATKFKDFYHEHDLLFGSFWVCLLFAGMVIFLITAGEKMDEIKYKNDLRKKHLEELERQYNQSVNNDTVNWIDIAKQRSR